MLPALPPQTGYFQVIHVNVILDIKKIAQSNRIVFQYAIIHASHVHCQTHLLLVILVLTMLLHIEQRLEIYAFVMLIIMTMVRIKIVLLSAILLA